MNKKVFAKNTTKAPRKKSKTKQPGDKKNVCTLSKDDQVFSNYIMEGNTIQEAFRKTKADGYYPEHNNITNAYTNFRRCAPYIKKLQELVLSKSANMYVASYDEVLARCSQIMRNDETPRVALEAARILQSYHEKRSKIEAGETDPDTDKVFIMLPPQDNNETK